MPKKQSSSIVPANEANIPFADRVVFLITARPAFRGQIKDYEFGIKLILGKIESDSFPFEGGRIHAQNIDSLLDDRYKSTVSVEDAPTLPVGKGALPPITLLEMIDRDDCDGGTSLIFGDRAACQFAKKGKMEVVPFGDTEVEFSFTYSRYTMTVRVNESDLIPFLTHDLVAYP